MKNETLKEYLQGETYSATSLVRQESDDFFIRDHACLLNLGLWLAEEQSHHKPQYIHASMILQVL